MNKFKVKDRVKCVSLKGEYDASPAWFTVGKIYKVESAYENLTYKSGQNGTIRGDDGSSISFHYGTWKKIGGSMYDELKSRIEGLQNGWDKEADDILNEIYELTNNHYHISISIAQRKDKITIRAEGYGGTDIQFFDFDTQCEKLSAFKQALLWLLDHSDIKKDIVGNDVKADIEGKTYRVRILEAL